MLSVTRVPLPGAERTLTESIKLSITAKPRPARSAPPVVNSGSIALETSGIPHPLSATAPRSEPSSYNAAVSVIGPMVFA